VKGQGHHKSKCGQKSTLTILKLMRLNTNITDNLSSECMILVNIMPLKTILN